jgi:adenylate cyclase
MTLQLRRVSNREVLRLKPETAQVLGRSDDVDFVVPENGVSRRHAEVRLQPDIIHVRDLGSSLGTFINGRRVTDGVLRADDVLTLASIDFSVEQTGEQAKSAVPIGTPVFTSIPRPATPAAGMASTPRRPAPAGATIVRPVISRAGAPLGVPVAGGTLRAVMAGNDDSVKNAQKLQLLLDVSKGLTKTPDIAALLVKIADYVFTTLDAERCAILLLDDHKELVTRISRDKRGADAPQAVPRSIVRAVCDDKVAILSDNAGADERFSGQSIVIQQVRSAICAPLLTSEDVVLGVIYADSSFKAHHFNESDLDFLIAFAGIAAVAIEHGTFSERIRKEALVRSNFERFFTPNLASRIANSADAVKLGGEKRRVAVMFTDIRGFTPLSERMKPDEIAKLLTEYFTEMVDCVFRHNGTLDKFIGDAVMAQWGAPIAADDDADNAMETALDMMTALDTLNVRWEAEGRPTLQIGIGLTIGEAFAGNIGSERRLEYTVIGDTVNTASRLCSEAAEGEILLSEEMLSALRRPPTTRALPPMKLAGKRDPVPVFTVVRKS